MSFLRRNEEAESVFGEKEKWETGLMIIVVIVVQD
jgi:hypothetical protein